jgi:ABC-type nitrate/sulfonate/bicarbonate transport system substrate-binding protein
MKTTASVKKRFAAGAILPLGLLAWVGLATPARAAMEHTSMGQTPAIVAFLAAYIAEDAGIWRDNDLDVKVINLPGIATVNAVIAGSVDFALGGSDTLTRAAAHGQPLLGIASINDQAGQMTVLRKELAEAEHFDPKAPLEIRARVLRGKNIAAGNVGSVADVFLKVIAYKAGIPESGMTISSVGAFDVLGAFSRRAVDGISISMPYPQQLVADGTAVTVIDGTRNEPADLMPLAAGLVITRPKLCAEHRSICEKMGHSMVQATRFLLDRKAESISILVKRFPKISEDVMSNCYDGVVRMTKSPPTIEEIALHNGDRMNAEGGFLKAEDKVSSYDGLFTNAFLR